jgi:aspartate-semialdehyde dehydrogenase
MGRRNFRVGIVGATGLVGREMVKVLEDRDFAVKELKLFASERSLGEKIEFRGEEIAVEVLDSKSLKGAELDFALFATSAELSSQFVPVATASGAIAIDNSSHFRMNQEIPLVVPEVNASDIEMAKSHRIIANPNCSTIQLVCCLKPLHDRVPLKRVVVSSYQSVSGAGSDAIDELESQIRQLFSNEAITRKVFPHQIAFNCIPQIDSFTANGFTKEEMKIIQESRKILHLSQLRITATTVRVPTLVSHAESVNVEFDQAFDVEAARDALAQAGIQVLDEPSEGLYPLGFNVAGTDEVYAGRIRRDESVPHGLHLWIVADNLRKGAATNAVQIAEECVERGFLRATV